MNKLEFATKMQARTKVFAVQIVKFFGDLPKSDETRVLGRQLLRSGTSVAANYRAVCRSIGQVAPLKSEADELVRIFQTSLNTAKHNGGR